MQNTIIVSEIGINSSGNIDTAKKLIKGAKDAGCDAVKFQKRDVETVYTKEYLDSYRESPWGTTQRAQKEGLEFDKVEWDIIVAYSKMLDIKVFASAWDTNSQLFLQQYNLSYNKIASALLGHTKLLEMVASEGKYTFISTGMATLEEIRYAVEVFNSAGCEFQLMHCNSTYPLNPKDANLNCMKTLRDLFKCKVGFSSHTVGIITPVAAVALGASSIEVHITLDRSAYGSDNSSSLELSGLRRLVDYIREVELALGSNNKIITSEEEVVRAKLRRTYDN